LTAIEEHDKQPWATRMKDLLLEIKEHVATARAQGEMHVDDAGRAAFVARYQAIVAEGYVANPPPEPDTGPKKRGRRKQSKARNLLDRLSANEREVLAFMTDWRVPFDNNQAERDLRMIKVQQKVSGCFRSPTGAVVFCRVRGSSPRSRNKARRSFPRCRVSSPVIRSSPTSPLDSYDHQIYGEPYPLPA